MDKLSVEELEAYCVPEPVKEMADKLSVLNGVLKDVPDEKILEGLKNMG